MQHIKKVQSGQENSSGYPSPDPEHHPVGEPLKITIIRVKKQDRNVSQSFVFFMGLFNGHYLIDKDTISFNLIKCRKRMCNMKTVYPYAIPQLQEFFIPTFSRKRVCFQGCEMCPDNPLAFFDHVNVHTRLHRYRCGQQISEL